MSSSGAWLVNEGGSAPIGTLRVAIDEICSRLVRVHPLTRARWSTGPRWDEWPSGRGTPPASTPVNVTYETGMTRNHTVLVVDDEPSVRALYMDALVESGHRVEAVADGAEALARLRMGVVPCVVLSDVRMPRMDGWELSRAIADDPQLSSVPVVVLTGDRMLSFTSPARDKPFAATELDALVERSCLLHRVGPHGLPGTAHPGADGA